MPGLSITITRPLRQFARTKQPARSPRPTRTQPPAGSHKLQLSFFLLEQL
jgi:hypothetical protein